MIRENKDDNENAVGNKKNKGKKKSKALDKLNSKEKEGMNIKGRGKIKDTPMNKDRPKEEEGVEEYLCPIHSHEDGTIEEKAKMILDAQSITLVVDEKNEELKHEELRNKVTEVKVFEQSEEEEHEEGEKKEEEAYRANKEKKQEEINEEPGHKHEKEEEKVFDNEEPQTELEQGKNKEPSSMAKNVQEKIRIDLLKSSLLSMKDEYNALLKDKSMLNSEEQELNNQLKALTKDLQTELQTRKGLSLYLQEINKQVNQQYSSASTKIIKPKFFNKMPDINSALTLKDKEETNLNKLTFILHQEAGKYESLYKQYQDPKVVEEKITTLDEVNKMKRALEEELVTLKKVFIAHSKCLGIEKKLEEKLRDFQFDHSNVLVSYDVTNKTYEKETNKTTISKVNVTQVNKPRNTKAKAQSSCFEEYVKAFSVNKKQSSSQAVWDGQTRLPQLTLFKPQEVTTLQEVIPQEQLKSIESRFKVINDNRKKIKVQMNQEEEYYKHSNEKILQAHYDNMSKVQLEKKRSKILLIDLKKDELDFKNIKTRIKQVGNLITSIHADTLDLERSNKDIKEIIELLSNAQQVTSAQEKREKFFQTEGES